MAQQALGRNNDQRLAVRPYHLPPQQVVHLHGCCRNANLHVVVGALLQKALDTRRRMFGAGAFVSVRQHQRQTAHAAPFDLARSDKLVDHDLGAVGKIAVLRLPYDEFLGSRSRIAVLEAHHGFFREH